jgi:hypothetical protein
MAVKTKVEETALTLTSVIEKEKAIASLTAQQMVPGASILGAILAVEATLVVKVVGWKCLD